MIADLYIEPEFMSDYDTAPEIIQDKVDWLVDYIWLQKEFPNSFHHHKAGGSYIWIGYVTRSRQHWRILFEIDEYTDEVYFTRLVTHREMDRLLRNNEYANV